MIFLEDVMYGFPNFDEITNGVLRIFLQQKCAEFSDFD